MAFTGVPVVERISQNCFKISGVSLGIGAAGTIGFSQSVTAEAKMSAPEWQPQGNVSLQDAIEVRGHLVGAAAVAPALQVVKTGTTHVDFLATVTNGGAALSGALEFYVQFF